MEARQQERKSDTLENGLLQGDTLWMHLASATLTAIWKARCREVFEDTSTVPALPLLKDHIKTLIKMTHHHNNDTDNSIAMWTKRGAFASVVRGAIVFSL